MLLKLFLLCLVNVVISDNCYWNAECPYLLYSSKNPYDTIRGDIRDYPTPDNCEAVSLWSLHRHGNRNPGSSVTEDIRIIANLKDDIVASYDAGRSQLCAQDIDEFRRWTWNETLEVSQSDLTGIGYEELFDIASRLRQKYPQLLQGSADDFYFRTTNEQRTVTSTIAFVHGLTEGTNLTLGFDGPWERDDVIRPYQNCERYMTEVRGGQELEDQVNDYMATQEYAAVRNAVQQRLGIDYQLTGEDIYSLYEICRFYRSWTATKQSPWCSVFTDHDLIVLEYRDDVRHYYRNGYGSWINVNLGGPALRDLYENFGASVQGRGKNIISYFTHDTMMQMTYSAMGLFRDTVPLQGSRRDEDRLWRSSFNGAFANNLIAVLNSCTESGVQSYRVQLFVNEKETILCPLSGCSWQEFQNIFQQFANATLDFCNMDNRDEFEEVPSPGGSVSYQGVIHYILATLDFCNMDNRDEFEEVPSPGGSVSYQGEPVNTSLRNLLKTEDDN